MMITFSSTLAGVPWATGTLDGASGSPQLDGFEVWLTSAKS